MGSLNADTSASKYQALPQDVYTVRLTNIEERTGQFGPYWLWKYEVENPPEPEGDFEWKTFVTVFTANTTNPEISYKNKMKSPRLAAEALLGRKIADNEFLEGDEYVDLVGCRCRMGVSSKEVDGKLYNEASALLPLKGARGNLAAVPNPEPAQKSLEQELEESGTPEHDRSLGLNNRKATAVRALGWSASDESEYQADFFKNSKPWLARTLVEKGKYVEHLEELAEANDIPFEMEDPAKAEPATAGKSK